MGLAFAQLASVLSRPVTTQHLIHATLPCVEEIAFFNYFFSFFFLGLTTGSNDRFVTLVVIFRLAVNHYHPIISTITQSLTLCVLRCQVSKVRSIVQSFVSLDWVGRRVEIASTLSSRKHCFSAVHLSALYALMPVTGMHSTLKSVVIYLFVSTSR